MSLGDHKRSAFPFPIRVRGRLSGVRRQVTDVRDRRPEIERPSTSGVRCRSRLDGWAGDKGSGAAGRRESDTAGCRECRRGPLRERNAYYRKDNGYERSEKKTVYPITETLSSAGASMAAAKNNSRLHAPSASLSPSLPLIRLSLRTKYRRPQRLHLHGTTS